MSVEERVLQLDGARGLVAFTGPVGRAFTEDEVAQLKEHELALWLGGLGDSEALARENLARVASRRVATVFIAGGADRWPIVERAFAGLGEEVPIVQGSGLRQLRVGEQAFAIAAGAPRGRYAVDDQGCGLTPEDIAALQREPARYLLSWQAPAASPELAELVRALGIQGGLHAFPEGDDAWAVPRLGAPGTLRGDGARLSSRVGHFVLGVDGLQPQP